MIRVSVQEPCLVRVRVLPPPIINVKVDGKTLVVNGGEEYDGAYVIQPSTTEDRNLSTKDKRMIDDVTVQKIPYFEVGNQKGITVIIGGEA